jgi:two-component system, OmpR family, sensor histidine kinase PhoQ
LRWGLRPLRHVAGELSRLESGEREELGGDYPEEVKGLADNLNAVLRHERAQQRRYRDALADLAHALKTPLSLIRAELRNAGADRRLAGPLEEQVERMDRVVRYHLQRASASGRRALSIAQPVRPLVVRVANALQRVHAEKSVDVDFALADSLRARVDEGDLTEILGNLLDNAFKWSRGTVRVQASVDHGALIVQVEDDGPGIPQRAAQEVLERGVRADESKPGHGIGLAVVRDIVEAYQGRVEIDRSPLGGALVRLVLPGTVPE